MVPETQRLSLLDRRGFIGATAAAATLMGSTLAEAQSAPDAPSPQPPAADPATVKVERQGGVLLIAIDRADARNKIDFPTYVALGRAYYAFEQDDALRVAVLYGKGPDFSRGIDAPSWAKALSSRLPQATDFIDPLGVTGAERSKPVIVAVQGQVVRIAHELFLAADIRVAANDASFNQGEVHGAAFPGGGGTIRFVREAGWGNAMRYMLSGDSWGADEARRMGIVQDVTPVGQQLDRALEIAKRVASAAPLGVRAAMASSHRALAEGEKAAFAALGPEFVKLLRSQDRQEFFRAQQENRPPVYVGR